MRVCFTSFARIGVDRAENGSTGKVQKALRYKSLECRGVPVLLRVAGVEGAVER